MELMNNVLKNSKMMELDLKSNNDIPVCKVCKEPTGKVVEMYFGIRIYPRACKCKRDKFKKEQIEAKNKEKQTRLQRIIKNSMMNDNFRKCTLKNWNHSRGNEKLFEIAKYYINNFKKMKRENKGILLHGESGNGKSYFSACISNSLLEQCTPVICVGAIALTERINEAKKTFGEGGIFTVLNSLDNADLLIIDDLGTEEDNKWTRAMVYQIIEKRNSTNLPVIITTNIPIDELKSRYDYRTYSRLMEMCSFIQNTGPDIRKIKGKEKTNSFLTELFEVK